MVLTSSKLATSGSKTETKQDELRSSLVLLMQLFHLKVASLGESTETTTPECPDGTSRKGFSFDPKIGLAVNKSECLFLSPFP